MEMQSSKAAYSFFPEKPFVRIIEHFRQEFVLCVCSFRFEELHEDLYVFKKNRGIFSIEQRLQQQQIRVRLPFLHQQRKHSQQLPEIHIPRWLQPPISNYTRDSSVTQEENPFWARAKAGSNPQQQPRN